MRYRRYSYIAGYRMTSEPVLGFRIRYFLKRSRSKERKYRCKKGRMDHPRWLPERAPEPKSDHTRNRPVSPSKPCKPSATSSWLTPGHRLSSLLLLRYVQAL